MSVTDLGAATQASTAAVARATPGSGCACRVNAPTSSSRDARAWRC
ncbi:MAG: hypothetical protein U0326_29105 [Polyangiales bacterium]